MSNEKKQTPSLWAKLKKKVQSNEDEGVIEKPEKQRKSSLCCMKDRAKEYFEKSRKRREKNKSKRRSEVVKKAKKFIKKFTKPK